MIPFVSFTGNRDRVDHASRESKVHVPWVSILQFIQVSSEQIPYRVYDAEFGGDDGCSGTMQMYQIEHSICTKFRHSSENIGCETGGPSCMICRDDRLCQFAEHWVFSHRHHQIAISRVHHTLQLSSDQ